MRSVMSGNEAIARGAWEAGVAVATAYPGTPSTEILENVATYPDIYSEWSVNEKVAVEVAVGATEVGARCLSAMKVVGLNVAADPIFNASYVGTPGYVIVVADDPGRYSSQTEQGGCPGCPGPPGRGGRRPGSLQSPSATRLRGSLLLGRAARGGSDPPHQGAGGLGR